MSTIQQDIYQLKEINMEINRLQKSVKKLKGDGNQVEKRIISYLQEKNEKGVKTKDSQGSNTGFILHTTQKTLTKTEVEKKKTSLDILKSNGVPNPEKVLSELLQSRKGDKINIPKLKIIQK